MNNLSLVFVNPIGKNSKDIYEYEFFFSETPDIVWGENWEIQCPSACSDILPDETTYSEIKHLKTDKKLFCAQENSCFSLQDVIDGCISVCFEDINNLQIYPEPYRLVLHFGDKYDKVCELLHGLDLDFEENKPAYTPPERKNDEEETDVDDFDDDSDPTDLNF